MADYSKNLRPAEWGSQIKLHGNNLVPSMSALGQKRTLGDLRLMSALPPRSRNVRFVPEADIMHCSKQQPHSISSSAFVSSAAGSSMPSALAVFKLKKS